MRTIGLRASPQKVTFAIFNGEADEIENIEDICAPSAMILPEQLKFIRQNVLDSIREYGVVRAAIRISESNARSVNTERIQIEGVVQELLASSPVERYEVVQISRIAKFLKIERSSVRPIIEGRNDLDIDGWDEMGSHQRESVLAAMGVFHA